MNLDKMFVLEITAIPDGGISLYLMKVRYGLQSPSSVTQIQLYGYPPKGASPRRLAHSEGYISRKAATSSGACYGYAQHVRTCT
jgi:hypothetical protein